uniref:Fumarylacetoacetate hydrolase n=1 Tax=Steinernema glaseri TaxID=37863 RepID=A0A1I7Y7B0_9BILA
MSDIAAKLAEHELVPSVLPEAPAQLLNCCWDGIQVQPGQTMSPRNLKFAPRVTLKVDPESTFSMVMIGKHLKNCIFTLWHRSRQSVPQEPVRCRMASLAGEFVVCVVGN